MNAPTLFDEFMQETAEALKAEPCRPGDLWQLGNHRLYCGSSTDSHDVAVVMQGEKARLIVTDPPYGMKKEAEGILNDNQNATELLEFNRAWFQVAYDNLDASGSFYVFGNPEPLMDFYAELLKPLIKAKKITFRNWLTWWKGEGGIGCTCEGNRSFFNYSEYLLFFTNGVIKGKTQDLSTWYEGFEPLRRYFVDETKKAGATVADVVKITNTGAAHYYSRSQFAFPTKENYNKIRDHFRGRAFSKEYEPFRKEYDELAKEYEVVRREYLATCAYFNPKTGRNSVWQEVPIQPDERAQGGMHPSVKPQRVITIPILASSRPGDVVFDGFGGSGSTLIACETLGRCARLVELDPRWCDVIIERWQKMTGQRAKRINI